MRASGAGALVPRRAGRSRSSERTPSARATDGRVARPGRGDEHAGGRDRQLGRRPAVRLGARVADRRQGGPRDRARRRRARGAVGGQRRHQDRLGAADRVGRAALADARLPEVHGVAVEAHAHGRVGRRGHTPASSRAPRAGSRGSGRPCSWPRATFLARARTRGASARRPRRRSRVRRSANNATVASLSRGRNRSNPRIRTSPGAPARTQLLSFARRRASYLVRPC